MSGSVNIQYCSYTDVEKQESHCCTVLVIPLNFMFYLRVPRTPVRMNSYKFCPCSMFTACKILRNSCSGTTHTKDPRMRHRRIHKGRQQLLFFTPNYSLRCFKRSNHSMEGDLFVCKESIQRGKNMQSQSAVAADLQNYF